MSVIHSLEKPLRGTSCPSWIILVARSQSSQYTGFSRFHRADNIGREIVERKAMHTLKTNGLVKTFSKRTVVRGISIAIEQGEIVGLLGPNGAGKTTTFRMITGEVDADAGAIYFDDTEITSWPMYKRARLGIAYLPQEPSAFRGLTTEENIVAVMEMNKYSREQIQERVEELLTEFSMHSRRRIKASHLSGGERRRLEVMRAMALRPHFVLLDEPFAGVDPIAVEELQSIVGRLKTKDVGVLITDHNVHETLEIADRAYVISEGQILVHGTPVEIAENAIARKVFLGQQFKLRSVPAQGGKG
jgi:lipopolysaccharide export system ATP-binding protein